MREKDIEQFLIEECHAAGILCYKFTSPNQRGVPDRLLIHDSGVYFVELKTLTGRLSKLQERTIERFRQEGVDVHVIATKPAVLDLVQSILKGTAKGGHTLSR